MSVFRCLPGDWNCFYILDVNEEGNDAHGFLAYRGRNGSTTPHADNHGGVIKITQHSAIKGIFGDTFQIT